MSSKGLQVGRAAAFAYDVRLSKLYFLLYVAILSSSFKIFKLTM